MGVKVYCETAWVRVFLKTSFGNYVKLESDFEFNTGCWKAAKLWNKNVSFTSALGHQRTLFTEQINYSVFHVALFTPERYLHLSVYNQHKTPNSSICSYKELTVGSSALGTLYDGHFYIINLLP